MRRWLTYFDEEPKSAVVLGSVILPALMLQSSAFQIPGMPYLDTPRSNQAFPSTRKILNGKCGANLIVVMGTWWGELHQEKRFVS
jgi:hypothetical protein